MPDDTDLQSWRSHATHTLCCISFALCFALGAYAVTFLPPPRDAATWGLLGAAGFCAGLALISLCCVFWSEERIRFVRERGRGMKPMPTV